MAKSIRSKSKLRAKTVKRENEFGNFVDARNKRISDKLAGHMKVQREEAIEKKKELVEAGELQAADLAKAEARAAALLISAKKIAAFVEESDDEPVEGQNSAKRRKLHKNKKAKGKKGGKTNNRF